MTLKNRLTESLKIQFPLIQAPMFLVSNEAMMKAGMEAGTMSVFPTLNFRDKGALKGVVDSLMEYRANLMDIGSFGVNLIVQKTNISLDRDMAIALDGKVPFFITSLGSPQEVIAEAHKYGAKVFCDVTNLKHAEKVAEHNCDGFIAVGAGAGGHAGRIPTNLLVEGLRKRYPQMLLVAAGGIATGQGIASALTVGADGVSVGTRFIASTEAGVNSTYKEAIVKSDMDDIVMTTRLSGTPCSVINTPEVQKMGLEQSWLAQKLNKSSLLKKYFKMMVQIRGLGRLSRSVKPGNYSNIWSAGQSVEMIDDIKPIAQIVKELREQTDTAIRKVSGLLG